MTGIDVPDLQMVALASNGVNFLLIEVFVVDDIKWQTTMA